ncbi:mitotic fidelity of chromosome transmission- protein [Hypoxylon texense]
MGWMWSSPTAPSKGSGSDSNSTSSESNKPPPAPKEPQSIYGDVEIDKFMAELQAGFGNSSSKPAEPAQSTPPPASSESQAPTKPSSSWFSWGSSSSTQVDPSSSPSPSDPATYTRPRPQKTTTADPAVTPDRLDPISESLLPTRMSCAAAFDAAFHCNSLGGQWTSVYRAGAVRSCGDKWDDFWFCMRTRAYSPPEKEEAIRAHYRAKEWAKYHAPGRPSSTDVWDARDRKVEPGSAFREAVEVMPDDVSDEEWRRREIERRRQVQEMLRSEERS